MGGGNSGVCRGRNVTVGRNVIFDGRITIGDDTVIGHNAILLGDITIGSGNRIGHNVVIGTGPQHRTEDGRDARGGPHRITIGNRNVIREGVCIHRPVGEVTGVGDDNYIMNRVTIPHDAVVDSHVTVADNVSLGGHVRLHPHTFLGFGANVHQHVKIGKCAMIGMGTAITKDVLPFSLISRGRFTKVNGIGLRRIGASERDISGICAMYEALGDTPPGADAQRWYERDLLHFLGPDGSSLAGCFAPPPRVTAKMG